jgi:hypothetical protein
MDGYAHRPAHISDKVGQEATVAVRDLSAQKRVAIYVRVSTDAQTTKNQRHELEAWAERASPRQAPSLR